MYEVRRGSSAGLRSLSVNVGMTLLNLSKTSPLRSFAITTLTFSPVLSVLRFRAALTRFRLPFSDHLNSVSSISIIPSKHQLNEALSAIPHFAAETSYVASFLHTCHICLDNARRSIQFWSGHSCLFA